MKILHIFLWTCFATSFIFLAGQEIHIVCFDHVCYHPVILELADYHKLSSILSNWNDTYVHAKSLIHYARINTRVDFIFILGYTGAIIMTSYNLMQGEKNPKWNNLLRLCFPLAVLIGLLDIVENIILLYDMHDYPGDHGLIISLPVSAIKWLLTLFVLAIIIIAAFRRLRFASTKKLN
ncbi:MAG TPA: hypothetical protein VGZ71_06415 [Puia sp.]|jgi:hypothetical protein|nr:hypothetical protein [Puia sp.]